VKVSSCSTAHAAQDSDRSTARIRDGNFKLTSCCKCGRTIARFSG
jgi:hypothetical protein